MDPVPEIKLIRTDTTLDLSQKAEKVWVEQENTIIFIDWKKNLKHGEKQLFFLQQLRNILFFFWLPKNIQHLRFPCSPLPQY